MALGSPLPKNRMIFVDPGPLLEYELVPAGDAAGSTQLRGNRMLAYWTMSATPLGFDMVTTQHFCKIHTLTEFVTCRNPYVCKQYPIGARAFHRGHCSGECKHQSLQQLQHEALEKT